MSKLLILIRAAVVATMLSLGIVASAPVMAQDATEVAGQVTNQAEEVVEDDDGFDWGLLGLLGLAGLAGLMRRPQPVVHDIDRSRTTNPTVTRTTDRTDSGGTSI